MLTWDGGAGAGITHFGCKVLVSPMWSSCVQAFRDDALDIVLRRMAKHLTLPGGAAGDLRSHITFRKDYGPSCHYTYESEHALER